MIRKANRPGKFIFPGPVCFCGEFMEKNDFIVVGLGNPGAEYSGTRHNIGFCVLDELVSRYSGGVTYREKYQAHYCAASVGGVKLHCIKPMTYMNRSGQSVAQFVNFYKVKPAKIVVIHDDLDMAVARVKLVKGGGAGGHNGIKSIVASIGTNDFYRLKIGIGRPGQGDVHKDFPVEKYVLSNFTSDDLKTLESRYAEIVDGLELLLKGDEGRAKGVLNSLK
jgi:peptidyl-tRNA hydrolase, PTH1 family